jgi:predicted nucleic acid-binding protein
MFFSLISYGEVIQGILFGREVERRTEEFERLVDQLELVGLDPETMRIFATLRGSLEREGLRLPDFDLLIAATALRHDHTLVSRNLGHFNRIPNLRLVTPGS